MKTPDLAGGLAAAALLCLGSLACAQTATTPARTVTPPVSVGANGKPRAEPQASKVLADPDTKMYSLCTPSTEQGPISSASEYKRPPKAVIITEEEAKARGYRAGAHKAPCE